jgi:RNA polymerase sigma factor (sigma-70 family)
MGVKQSNKAVVVSGMDEPHLRRELAGVVKRLTGNVALRQDLMQEALVHLWLIRARRPGQTQSWYLQSCRFRLQHYLSSGRSVDSTKRRGSLLRFEEYEEENEELVETSDSGNTVLNSVSAREIMGLLANHLTDREKDVLDCLADGLGAREIGRELSISHTMVIRHRRKIAALLHRFGVLKEDTLSNGNGFKVNGKR